MGRGNDGFGCKYSRTKEEWRLKKMGEERTERENCDRI